MTGLQLLTSYRHEYKSEIFDVCHAALDGGVTAIQFCWASNDAEIFATAEQLRILTASFGAKLIVNNRLDVALAVEADGLHIGQRDIPLATARRLIPPDMILGLSVSSPSEISDLTDSIVDYYGVGPVFASITNPATPIGIDGLRAIRFATSRPIVAIGGITPLNSRLVFSAGANDIAVIGCVYRSECRVSGAKKILESERLYKVHNSASSIYQRHQ